MFLFKSFTTETETFFNMTWTEPVTILITGASGGFGKILVDLFADHSPTPTIIATGRSLTRPSSLPSSIIYEPLDLSRNESVTQLTDSLALQGHNVDILVNCAGFATLGALECFSDQELETVVQVNFLGPTRLIRALIPGMRERRRGMIAHIGSGAGVDGRESMSVYGAAKAGMDGLLRVLAKEMSPFDVRVLSIPLGSFNTPFAAGVKTTSAPLPLDYEGKDTEAVMKAVTDPSWTSDGDVDKAAKVIYEVIMGIGVGQGKGAETLMPLGRDMYACLERAVEKSQHALQMFRDVCNGVSADTAC